MALKSHLIKFKRTCSLSFALAIMICKAPAKASYLFLLCFLVRIFQLGTLIKRMRVDEGVYPDLRENVAPPPKFRSPPTKPCFTLQTDTALTLRGFKAGSVLADTMLRPSLAPGGFAPSRTYKRRALPRVGVHSRGRVQTSSVTTPSLNYNLLCLYPLRVGPSTITCFACRTVDCSKRNKDSWRPWVGSKH